MEQKYNKYILNKAYDAPINQIINDIKNIPKDADTLVFLPGTLFDIKTESDYYVIKRPFEEVMMAIDAIPFNIKHLWFSNDINNDYDLICEKWRSQLPYYINYLSVNQAIELSKKICDERFTRITFTMLETFSMFGKERSKLFLSFMKQKDIVFCATRLWCSDYSTIFEGLRDNLYLKNLFILRDDVRFDKICDIFNNMSLTLYMDNETNNKLPNVNIVNVERDYKIRYPEIINTICN